MIREGILLREIAWVGCQLGGSVNRMAFAYDPFSPSPHNGRLDCGGGLALAAVTFAVGPGFVVVCVGGVGDEFDVSDGCAADGGGAGNGVGGLGDCAGGGVDVFAELAGVVVVVGEAVPAGVLGDDGDGTEGSFVVAGDG